MFKLAKLFTGKSDKPSKFLLDSIVKSFDEGKESTAYTQFNENAGSLTVGNMLSLLDYAKNNGREYLSQSIITEHSSSFTSTQLTDIAVDGLAKGFESHFYSILKQHGNKLSLQDLQRLDAATSDGYENANAQVGKLMASKKSASTIIPPKKN